MKSCEVCFESAADSEPTCLSCGEASWSNVAYDSPAKATEGRRRRPLSASDPYSASIADAAKGEKPGSSES